MQSAQTTFNFDSNFKILTNLLLLQKHLEVATYNKLRNFILLNNLVTTLVVYNEKEKKKKATKTNKDSQSSKEDVCVVFGVFNCGGDTLIGID